MTEPLPDSWAWSTVGEMSNVVLGQSPPGSSYNEVGHGSPFFQGKAEFRDLYPEVSKWTTQPKKIATNGSILVSVRAPVGPTNIAPFDCAIGRGLAALCPLGGMGSSYLLWAMRHTEAKLAKQGTGSTFDAITGTQLKSHLLPTAPLAEQERIVAAIEEHFSRIDAAESAAQTALARLDTLRRAILTAAFSGHLIKPLNSSRTSNKNASNWDVKELSDLLDHTTGGIWGSKPGEEEVDVDVVRVTELTLNGGLNTATAARRSITHKQYSSRLLKKGDILLEKSGGGPTTPVGRVALFDYHIGPAICTNFMQLMRPKYSVIRSKFLFWQLHLWHIQGRTAKLQKGSSNIRNLQTKQYLAEVVSYPDLTRQDQIIAVIEECFSRIDAAAATLERCLQRCNILRRAVLAAAFSGRLVEQDPNDETASVLLERIAAEQPKRHTQRKSA